MSLTFERKLLIILFFVFLIFTTIGILLYQSTVSTQEAVRWQKESQEVTSKIDETIGLALELQNAMKDFVVTNNSTYLESYNRALPKINGNIDSLRQLFVQNPQQQQELDRFEDLMTRFSNGVAERIDFRKQNSFELSVSQLGWSEGKAIFDALRSSGERIKAIETAVLNQRERAMDRRFSWIVWILIGSSVAGIVALGLTNLVVSSEIKKRHRAQNDLIDANEGLEKKVELRTGELKETNRRLHKIANERETILQNEKAARREAEIANRLRDEFMATISHELRTPLNSILGWARLMSSGSLSDAQKERALSTIIKSSETQNRLIEDLMDVARVISGKLQLEFSSLDPTDVVSAAIETVRPYAASKHIGISFSETSELSAGIVRGDRERLGQVFTNLLTNAIKFSPNESVIDVSIEFAEAFVSIRVRDEGKGISFDFLPVVFERFRQDAEGELNNGGLGLGLAIVRNLVELHGGSVRAESKGEDQGSTFIVNLPLVSDDLFRGIEKVSGENI